MPFVPMVPLLIAASRGQCDLTVAEGLLARVIILVWVADEHRSTVGQHGKLRLGRVEPLHATGDRYREAIALSVNQESHRLWPWEC